MPRVRSVQKELQVTGGMLTTEPPGKPGGFFYAEALAQPGERRVQSGRSAENLSGEDACVTNRRAGRNAVWCSPFALERSRKRSGHDTEDSRLEHGLSGGCGADAASDPDFGRGFSPEPFLIFMYARDLPLFSKLTPPSGPSMSMTSVRRPGTPDLPLSGEPVDAWPLMDTICG